MITNIIQYKKYLLPLITLLVLLQVLMIQFTSISNTGGWMMLIVNYLLILWYQPVSSSRYLLYTALLLLTVHNVIAIFFAFSPDISAIWMDALFFHDNAQYIASHGSFSFAFGYRLYAELLVVFYRVLGASRLLGAEISILLFLMAMGVFLHYLKQRHLLRFAPFLLLIFGGLPAIIIYTSVTLRESLELLGFMIFSLLAISLLKRPRPLLLLLTFIVGLVVGMLHKGLILYFFVIFLLVTFGAVYLSFQHRGNLIVSVVGILLLLLYAAAAILPVQLNLEDIGLLRGILNGNLWEAIVGGRALVDQAAPASGFGIVLDTHSLSSLVSSYLRIYTSYMLGPFPWQGSGFKYAVGLFDALLRWLLLLGLLHRLISLRFRVGFDDWILLLLFLSMTALWALGTTNYGQAMRHQVLTNWILLLLGCRSWVALYARMRPSPGSQMAIP